MAANAPARRDEDFAGEFTHGGSPQSVFYRGRLAKRRQYTPAPLRERLKRALARERKRHT